MTTTQAQFLYVSNSFDNPTEIINGARTARRLQSGDVPGFSDVIDNAGCDALLFQPCTMAADGTTSAWDMADFTPEASPWYTGSDASMEAYGFYIEEWTGIDGAHHGRSTTPLGRGGANFGPQSHGHRVMKLNVLLLGATERGLTHLFRWLEDTLLSNCDPCGSASMWMREFCPADPIADPSEGMGRLARVVLLEGPTWEAPVISRSGCFVRRASFALGAGDPCIYRDPVECLAATTRTLTTVPNSGNSIAPDLVFVAGGIGWSCTPSFSDVEFGVLAPRVTITSEYDEVSGQRHALPDLRISAYTNPGALVVGGGVGPYNLTKFGEMIITGRGTSGLEIVVDMAERSVTYAEITGPSPAVRVDGSRLIGRAVESSLGRWFTLRECDDALIAVEPVYIDLRNTTEGTTNTVGVVTVAIETVGRFGC